MMLRLTALGGLSIGGDAMPAGEVRPRRLALLAILAAAGAKGISREQALAILWSEREPDRARHSLSQTLYSLRRDLGVDVVLVAPNLRLDPDKMTSDVEDFRLAVAGRDWERGAELFTGPFLDGFYLADAPAFERWADEERTALTHTAIRAIETAAKRATDAHRDEQAKDYWRQLTKLDPVNGRFAAAYVAALSNAGDRTGALLHARSHADLVRRELELEPDAEILRAIESLRDAQKAEPVGPRVEVAVSSSMHTRSTPSPIPIGAPASVTSSRRRWTVPLGVAAALGVAIIMMALFWKRGVTAREPTSHTSSPLAQRLYEDGLRAFYQFDTNAARRLFGAALEEDSTFVMAAYFAWRSDSAANGPRQDSLAARAERLAGGASERDRLLVLTHLSASRYDLSAIPAAESLATKFPNDAETLIRAADVTNDLPRAQTLLDRAIALDSATGTAPSGICRLCEALLALVRRYDSADSVNRVEATLDRWSALRPGDYQPWLVRADYLIALGRLRDAADARRQADSLGAPRDESPEAALLRSLRSDDFATADTICEKQLPAVSPTDFRRFRWLCTIDLRMRGRYRDALGLVHDGRIPWTRTVRSGLPLDRVNAALLDMEMGRPATAAAEYSRLAAEAGRGSAPEGAKSRAIVWRLVLSATASALDGDTVRVRSLVDSVELIGHRSLYPRDPLVHHFLRGMLLSEAGDHEAAVREFRAAIWSPTQGYTRINYEMGRSLLASNRAAEAIPILRSALHGSVDGSGAYVTRTELHELLARAFAATGQRDSATTHYSVVERAWRGADPFLAPRYDAARQWLIRAGRSVQ